MRYGWKIFEYSKSANSNLIKSYCNTDISMYNMKLFKDQDNSKINLFTTASRSLELFVEDRIFEIRMLIWEEKETKVVILEKRRIDQVILTVIEKRIRFSTDDQVFEVGFYEKEVAKEFIELISHSKQKSFAKTGLIFSQPELDNVNSDFSCMEKTSKPINLCSSQDIRHCKINPINMKKKLKIIEERYTFVKKIYATISEMPENCVCSYSLESKQQFAEKIKSISSYKNL